MFSSGASTKNAGLACFGSLSELVEDNLNMGKESMLNLINMRLNGLQLLRDTLGDDLIDLELKGGYELFFEKKSETLEHIDWVNKLLRPFFNSDVFHLKNKKIKKFGFHQNIVHNLIENRFEGLINTGKMIRSLRSKVNQKDIFFFSNATVTNFENEKYKKKLYLSLENNKFKIITKKLAVCNNAFASKLFPELDITPGRGQVLITKPISGLKISGGFHYNKGYYYFRNIENRILIGGGRNLDFKSESTTKFGINQQIKRKLMNDLKNFILPNQEFSIDMEWSGIMAFGRNKNPIIKITNENVGLAVKLGGMGIAIGSHVGKVLADLLKD